MTTPDRRRTLPALQPRQGGEDAEIYFPKFGFGFGRESLFEMVKGFAGALDYIRHDYEG
jgi:hypothetical protein